MLKFKNSTTGNPNFLLSGPNKRLRAYFLSKNFPNPRS